MERERSRITLLLDINNELMQHASQLQADGQGGIMPPNSQTRDTAQQDAAGALAGGQKAASGDYLKYVQKVSRHPYEPAFVSQYYSI